MSPTLGIPVARTVADLRTAIARVRAEGGRVALVPTMGAFHEGHLALIRRAGEIADHVVVSIFVNPAQFGPGEDYIAYPRNEQADRQKLASLDIDILYTPAVEDIYPDGFSTTIRVGRLAESLCGAFRPGHFDGVATVVAKLFNQARPDIAIFGEKDYQQLQIIRRLTTDLDLGVIVEAVPTIREDDGLALSSRNAYLDSGQRRIAPELYRTLKKLAGAVAEGRDIETAVDAAAGRLKQVGFKAVDYVAVCDAETLSPVTGLDRSARVFAAAILGTARLIDNLSVPRKKG